MRSEIHPKRQPWKEEWPPLDTSRPQGPSHGIPEGSVLIWKGDTVSKPADRDDTESAPRAFEEEAAAAAAKESGALEE